LKDTGEGSGTFVRVDRPLILSNGFLIAFGESHMVVQIQKVRGDQMGETKTKLSLKFLDGPKAQESFTFWPNIKEIKIGRMSDCEIKINDNGLSRVQCIIKFKNDASQNWVLYDGAGPDKRSTNGTWVYVDDQFRVYDQMVFKACNYLFQARL